MDEIIIKCPSSFLMLIVGITQSEEMFLSLGFLFVFIFVFWFFWNKVLLHILSWLTTLKKILYHYCYCCCSISVFVHTSIWGGGDMPWWLCKGHRKAFVESLVPLAAFTLVPQWNPSYYHPAWVTVFTGWTTWSKALLLCLSSALLKLLQPFYNHSITHICTNMHI